MSLDVIIVIVKSVNIHISLWMVVYIYNFMERNAPPPAMVHSGLSTELSMSMNLSISLLAKIAEYFLNRRHDTMTPKHVHVKHHYLGRLSRNSQAQNWKLPSSAPILVVNEEANIYLFYTEISQFLRRRSVFRRVNNCSGLCVQSAVRSDIQIGLLLCLSFWHVCACVKTVIEKNQTNNK